MRIGDHDADMRQAGIGSWAKPFPSNIFEELAVEFLDGAVIHAMKREMKRRFQTGESGVEIGDRPTIGKEISQSRFEAGPVDGDLLDRLIEEWANTRGAEDARPVMRSTLNDLPHRFQGEPIILLFEIGVAKLNPRSGVIGALRRYVSKQRDGFFPLTCSSISAR